MVTIKPYPGNPASGDKGGGASVYELAVRDAGWTFEGSNSPAHSLALQGQPYSGNSGEARPSSTFLAVTSASSWPVLLGRGGNRHGVGGSICAREYLRNAGRTGRFASDRFAKIWND
jgi:hypothetical protein